MTVNITIEDDGHLGNEQSRPVGVSQSRGRRHDVARLAIAVALAEEIMIGNAFPVDGQAPAQSLQLRFIPRLRDFDRPTPLHIPGIGDGIG